MNVVNGLHEFLQDDPEFLAMSRAKNVEILDVRRPRHEGPAHLRRLAEVTCPRIAVLGTDCAIGKRNRHHSDPALNERGVKAVMIGTGQTCLIQGARYGVALDAIPSQFCSGELEATIVEAFESERPDAIVRRPGRARAPRVLDVEPHSPRLPSARGGAAARPGTSPPLRLRTMPMPTAAAEINLIQTFADTTVIGLAINHEHMRGRGLRRHRELRARARHPGHRCADPGPRTPGRNGVLGVPTARGDAGRRRAMSAPRLEIDLDKIRHNARTLVARLAGRGISVTVTKATLGSPAVAGALLNAGVTVIGDSRIENRGDAGAGVVTLLRAPMLSHDPRRRARRRELQHGNRVIRALSSAAQASGRRHGVVLMVELGDLREGIIATFARDTLGLPNIALRGIGANLACRSGVSPDARNMSELSALADSLDATLGQPVGIVSGGNSANLDWALGTADTGRINNLRLGE